MPVDPGAPPKIEDKPDKMTGMNDFQAAAVAVIERSNAAERGQPHDHRHLPGAVGNNDLGTNDGSGYSINPATGEPYAPDQVLRRVTSRGP